MEQLAFSIKAHLKTDFERSLFDAAIQNFNESNNPLRTNNFAYVIRELSRHLLLRLAPDEYISKCVWYEPQTNERGTVIITRAQRICYAVQGGLADKFVQETLNIDLLAMRSNFVKVIDKLSKFTHIEEHVFNIEVAKSLQVAINSLEALFELFSTIADCHEQVAYSVEKHINKRLLSTFLENTFNELDILATHHFIEGVQIESVRILSIGYRDVDLSVQGYVECELQYGSSSDLRHGDGASLNDSFPFTCKFIANVNNPLKPEINMKSLVIDNSSWYE